MQAIEVDEHPLLEVGLVEVTLDANLAESPSPDWLSRLLVLDADVPLERSEEVRVGVRKLLRYGGYRPTGRGKPASEYLVRAAGDEELSSINLCVDVCNVVSMHSGLPISVVDVDLVQGPLSIAIAGKDMRYVFNTGGQEIRLEGLLNLCDGDGPCANAVKDSQRTKTNEGTTRTLSVIWGTNAIAGRTRATLDWYAQLLERAGVSNVETSLLSE